MKYVVSKRDYYRIAGSTGFLCKVAEFDTQKEAEDYCVARNHHTGIHSDIRNSYHMWKKEEGDEEE